MKGTLLILFCLIGFKSFSQHDEAFVEEKASSWVKVVSSRTAGRPKATAVKRKVNPNPSRRENPQQEFDKTNNEVNRFKKSKKN